MMFGKSKNPDPEQKPKARPEQKPKARKGLDPKIRAHLYLNSLMSGTPEGTLSNASSLQSLMQDHPKVEFLTEEERLQISQFLANLGNTTPDKAGTFSSLADFFGTWKPEAEGPAPVKPEPEGAGPVISEAEGPKPVIPEPEGPEPVKSGAEGPGPVTPEQEGLGPVQSEAKEPAPVEHGVNVSWPIVEPGPVPAPPAKPAPAPPTRPMPRSAPPVSEEFGGSNGEVVSQFEGATPGPDEDLVILRGVEPGTEHRFGASPPASPSVPPQPEPAPPPSGELPAPPLGSGADEQDVPVTPGPYLGYDGETVEAPVEEDPLREAKQKYNAMYTDFANKVSESALSSDLSENRRALSLGLKLAHVLQAKQVALPMEDAVKLRNAFSILKKSFEEKGESALLLEVLRLAAAFGDEEAAKSLAAAGGPPGKPDEKTLPTVRPPASTPAGPARKGRPYDLPIDEIKTFIDKEAVGKEDLKRTLGPASILENMIKEGSAVPLKVLKAIVARAWALGDQFSGEGRWEEARLAYKLSLYFSRDKQAAYENAASRAEEARTKKLFVRLVQGDLPMKSPPSPSAPQEPQPAPGDEPEGGPKIIQGAAEAYSYLLQSGTGFEAPAQPTADSVQGIKPQYSDKYLTDPMHAYALLVSKDFPLAETVLRIIKLHKTDKYTVDLAMKHPVMQTPEMQARLEKILKE